MCVHELARVRVCMHTHTHTNAHTHAHMDIHTCTYTCTRMHTHTPYRAGVQFTDEHLSSIRGTRFHPLALKKKKRRLEEKCPTPIKLLVCPK